MRLPRPRLQRPKLKGPQFEPPQVLSDLYRDLKDRKLLPLVGLLLVAIVAVPVAISASSEGPSTASGPAAEIVPVDAPEAQAAVLAENPGLRNYKRRLDALKAKNPFEQQFQTTGLGQTAVQGTPETTETVGGGAVTEGSASPVDSDATTGAAPTGGGSAPVHTEDVDTTSTETKAKFFTWRLDVRYGVLGAAQKRDNVKVLDLLSPVGVFLGASFDAKKAFFFLSSDLVSSGEGQCQPAPENCEFLVLKEGQAQQFDYQAPGEAAPTTYTLELVDIKVVELKKPPLSE
jgi:hypothetical protein